VVARLPDSASGEAFAPVWLLALVVEPVQELALPRFVVRFGPSVEVRERLIAVRSDDGKVELGGFAVVLVVEPLPSGPSPNVIADTPDDSFHSTVCRNQ
jgi:hypothetical protein